MEVRIKIGTKGCWTWSPNTVHVIMGFTSTVHFREKTPPNLALDITYTKVVECGSSI
jgi:hypothetical protein